MIMAGMHTAVCVGVALTAAVAAAELAPADLPWLDPEEAAALLADLEEAGLLPADLDLAGLASPVRAAGELAPRRSWSCRVEGADDGRVRSSLDGRVGRLELQLRARRGREDAPEVGGCFWMEDPHWTAAAGGVGVQHGLGLLAAGPGRNRTAGISGSLLPGDGGLRRWSSPDAATGLRGIAAEWRQGPLAAGAMSGRFVEAAGVAATEPRVGWLAWRRKGLAVSALTADGGHSAALSVAEGALDLRAEIASWRGAAAAAGNGLASAVAVRWRGRSGTVEAMAATSSAGGAPALGSRPACLLGWDGNGWAVRGRAALSATLRGTILAAAAEDRPSRSTASDRALRQTFEAGVTGRFAPGSTWALRWRHREDRRWRHDETMPWLPPQPDGRQAIDTYVAEGALRMGAGDLGGALRWVARDDAEGRGRRAVASLAWRGPAGPIHATLGGTWAWGDPVAVSTVTTPVSGLVVPRSWSQWAEEVHAGADLATGPWRLQAAVARRSPAARSTGPAVWQAWLRLAVAW